MQAIMMVAGKSTRTYPLTLTRPKPLLPVLNRPLICSNLDQLVGIVEEVILIVGYKQEMIRRILGSEYRGMHIVYQEQIEQLGTGHAVLQAAPHVIGSCIVMNGDDLYARQDIEELLKFKYSALALTVDNPSLFGVFQVDSKRNVVQLVEKPREDLGNLANVGCYFFDKSIFAVLEKTPMSERGEIEITSAIMSLAQKEPFQVIPLEGYWLATGYPWDLLRTHSYFFNRHYPKELKGTIESGADVTGPVRLAENSLVAAGAKIVGPASVGSGCHIPSSAVIGPYTSLGDGVSIEPGARIAHSILFNNVHVGRESTIENSVVGEGVEIGQKCTFHDINASGETVKSEVRGKMVDTGTKTMGAIVGDGAKISEKTDILPGCKIWPGCKTRPGQVVDLDLNDTED